MRRGQLEMIGLVFIVLLLVVGIVLYAKFAGKSQTGDRSTKLQGAGSFLIALSETSVPSCGTSFSKVVSACALGKSFCLTGDPCLEAQRTMELLASETLDKQGIAYNLSIQGTPLAVFTDDCESANPAVDVLAAPNVEIVLGGGTTRKMTLALCG